jgi:RHS repeat-associated protein
LSGGLDAVLSTSGVVRSTNWVDQNGLSISPGTNLAAYASGQWYHRTFAIGSKAGESLSNFKIAHEGDAAGDYVILLDNIKITNGGVVRRTIYEDGFPLTSLKAEGPTGDIAIWTTNRSTTYYMAGAQRIAMRRMGFAGGKNGLNFLLADHLGSTSKIVKEDGATLIPGGVRLYKAWGELRYEPNGELITKHRYTGQYEEFSDPKNELYNYGARFYDPYIGQFNQPDSLIPNQYNPLDWNRYSYSRYNPLLAT